MSILYIMAGAGFAGKSTLAKRIAERFGIPLVSVDALYFEKEQNLRLYGKNSDEQWRTLVMLSTQRVRELLASGSSVVFDNTNLARKERDDLRTLAHEAGAEAVLVFLDTPTTTLDERQARNKITKERHDVEQHYLDEAKRELEIPSEDEQAHQFSPGMDTDVFIGTLPK